MGLFYAFVLYRNYREAQKKLDHRILQEMRIFSFRPTGTAFDVSFDSADVHKALGVLRHDRKGVHARFAIPGSRNYVLVLTLGSDRYKKRIATLRRELFSTVPLFFFLIAALSALFSLYALYPLKRALELNEEFVRDLLHDVNTPLSTLRINLGLLRRRLGSDDRVVRRMEESLDTIDGMQKNLRSFLDRHPLAVETFSLRELLASRCDRFGVLYASRGIRYMLGDFPDLKVRTNKEAFERIVDNLLDNAGKYNRPGGEVRIGYENGVLVVEDTGKGIEHPERIFERHYREGDRGLGLGLHIVKKFCDVLGIGISVESTPGEGSRFRLDLHRVMAG